MFGVSWNGKCSRMSEHTFSSFLPGKVFKWSANDLTPLAAHQLRTTPQPHFLRLSKSCLVVACKRSLWRFLDLETLTDPMQLNLGSASSAVESSISPSSIALSDRYLAFHVHEGDGAIRLYNPATLELLHSISLNNIHYYYYWHRMQILGDTLLLCELMPTSTVAAWNLQTQQQTLSFQFDANNPLPRIVGRFMYNYTLAMFVVGSLLVVGDPTHGMIYFLDISAGRCVRCIHTHATAVNGVHLWDDVLVTCSSDYSIILSKLHLRTTPA